MFGQPNNSPFGSPPASGFGQNPAPAFGAPAPSAFGAPAPSFGAPGGFGSPSAPFGAAPTPAPAFGGSSFGGGGSTFGGGGGFGAPSPAPAFGSSGFGSTGASPFGSPTPAPSGGLFGSAPAPAPGGLFGSAPAPTFGAPSPAPAFGAPAPAFGGSAFGASSPAPAFGAPAPAFGGSTFGATQAPASTGLFGQPQPQAPTGFGATGFGASPAPAFGASAQPPTGSIFGGSPAPAPGLFGAQPGQQQQQQGGGGTKQTPYTPTNRQDGTSTIQMQSISAMAAYENKNFDELRYEDYMQGNKGVGNAAAPGGFGGFGAAAPATGGLFGGQQAPAPAFGAPSTSPFGAPAPAPFGAPAPSAFGAPAPGAFGAQAPAPFGAAPAPAGFGGSTFGKPASGSLFGAPSAPTPGLFGGGSPTPAPAFGAPAPTGLFGSNPAPAPQGGGLFGNPAPAPQGGLFGSAPAPFGAPAPSQGFGGFGSPSPAPSTGLFGFGQAPAPSGFGAPAPGGLFGSQQAPAPAFGAPSTSLFGGQAQAPFGSPAPSAYGAQPALQQPAMPQMGSIIPQPATEVLEYQMRALENKRKEVQKLDVWRGQSPDESRVTPVSQPQYGGMSSSMVRPSPYTPHRQTPGSAVKIRPRGFGAALNPGGTPSGTTSTSPLDSMGTGGRAMMSPEAYASSSVKRLVIQPGSLAPKSRMRLRLTNTPANGEENSRALPVPVDADSPAAQTTETQAATAAAAAESSPSPMKSPTNTNTPYSAIPVYGRETVQSPGTSASPRGGPHPSSAEEIDLPPDPDQEYYQQVIGSPDGTPAESHRPPSASRNGGSSVRKRPSYIPKLTKPGYEVTPSLDELAVMSEADLAAVCGFSIRHLPYGVVEWDGAVDVRDADLDASIVIGQNDVSVYTRDEEEGRKPPVGSKLNRSAKITFFNVFPRNLGADADEESKNKFAKKIERSTHKMGADLIHYKKDEGEWQIRVQHFSRYGLDDDESEDDMDVTPEKFQENVWQDEDAAVVSDAEELYGDAMVEDAYSKIYDAVYSKPTSSDMELSEDPASEDENFDEGYDSPCEEEPASAAFTSAEDFVECSKQHSSAGISAGVSKKVFESERVPKNLEYGLRMGRSFHVGWSPDGSFLKLCPGGTKLQRFRPVFDDAKGLESTKYLDNHKASSQKLEPSAHGDDHSPRFILPLSIANAGDSTSHEALHRALSAFASEGEQTCDLAFALLACLIDDEHSVASGFDPNTKDVQFNARRKEALSRFFVDACKATTIADIREQNDVHSAVYTALTGGRLAEACEIAVGKGHENLAACIATFDVAGNSDLRDQARRAASGKIPESLRQIYQLLSGDIHCSSDLGWIRCFLMRLLYDSPQHTGADLAHALDAFRSDVKAAKAPFPGNQDGKEECILFRLLRLAESPQSISCSEIVDPSGFTFFKHDFRLPFIMSSALASAGVCGPLSTWQEERIIDGYVTQLISSGHWDWAVYVSLCSLNPDMLESSSTDWKRTKAKEIVLRHYKEGDSLSFLQDISVPDEWFSEALANRCASKGDPFTYISHLASFSATRTAAVLDEIVLPNIPFMDARGKERCLRLLEAAGGELNPLSAAYLKMCEIEQDLHAGVLQEHQLQMLQEIEVTFQAERSKIAKRGAPVLKFQAAFSVVPLPSMLSEAIDHCAFLKMKVKCLERNIEVDPKASQRRLTALLAFHE